MIIGVPKEIKDHEYRVALVPGGVKQLAKYGHKILVQQGAGVGAGFFDKDYAGEGAEILPNAEEVWKKADLILKVKEPLESEWPHIRRGQILFTYFHFASSKALTEAMMKSGAICIAYETVETDAGHNVLLTPMSEIAGRLSIQHGANYLEAPHGGRGVLLGGVPGVESAHVVVIGGGIVGYNAAITAAGMGARVTVMDIDIQRLRYLDSILPHNCTTLFSSDYNIRRILPTADLVVGAVLVVGAKAPNVVTREMLKIMKPKAVLVDVAIDQGGCFETSRPTSHSNPVYEVEGIMHYCVTNMPGAVSRTSTFALTNATLPYALQIASLGWPECARKISDIRKGVNIVDGKIVFPGVAEAFNLPYHPIDEAL